MANNTTAEQDYLLNLQEAGSFLAGATGEAPVGAAELRAMIKAGRLEGEQNGSGRWFVRLSELERYLAEREAEQAAKVQPAAKPTATQPEQKPEDRGELANPSRFRLVPLLDDGEPEVEEHEVELVPCPSCGAEIAVTSDAVVVECAHCGGQFEVEETDEGEPEQPPAKSEPKKKEPAPAAARTAAPVPQHPNPLRNLFSGRRR